MTMLVELAMIMDRLYGGVCYAGIDTDPELKYPKVGIILNHLSMWIMYFFNKFKLILLNDRELVEWLFPISKVT